MGFVRGISDRRVSSGPFFISRPCCARQAWAYTRSIRCRPGGRDGVGLCARPDHAARAISTAPVVIGSRCRRQRRIRSAAGYKSLWRSRRLDQPRQCRVDRVVVHQLRKISTFAALSHDDLGADADAAGGLRAGAWPRGRRKARPISLGSIRTAPYCLLEKSKRLEPPECARASWR